MFRIKGRLQVPDNLKEVIDSIPPFENKSPPAESSGYISSFKLKMDPVLLCTMFGLYKSQELPPTNKEELVLFSKSHEFNVEIGDFADLLNHFLFCLWVDKNGSPDKCADIMKYREELYGFVKKLLDPDYYRAVLIPFYLSKADQEESGTSSFTHRLASSDNVKLELEDHSPEFLKREFVAAQIEFIKNVIIPAPEARPRNPEQKRTDLTALLERDEDQCLEFKSTLHYDIKASEHGQEKVSTDVEKESLKTICAFMNSERGVLVIGVSDDRPRKIVGLSHDYKFLPHKQDRDSFEVYLRKRIPETIEPDLPKLVRVYFERLDDKDICVVEVEKSDRPVFLKGKVNGKEIREFYIRDGNQSRPLVGVSMADYIKRNWQQVQT